MQTSLDAQISYTSLRISWAIHGRKPQPLIHERHSLAWAALGRFSGPVCDQRRWLISSRKTQIALAYVYWLQETHPAISILWVHASSADRFRQSYMSIAEEYQIPGYADPKVDILLLVKDWLEKKVHDQWFMVLDNVDDMQLFFGSSATASSLAEPSQAGRASHFSDYLPECRHGSLMVTTRNKQLGVRLAKGQQPVEASRMNEDESKQLLLAKLGTIRATPAELSSLSSQLEHLPLALAQAAAYIHETCITVAQYLQLLGENDKNVVLLLDKEFETVGRDSSSF